MRSSFARWLAALVFVTGAVSIAPAARAAGKDRRFSSAKYGVTVDAPLGWTLSLHTGYPDILAVLLHPSGSRISIAATETTATGARALAEQNRRGLEAQRLSILAITDAASGAVILDAESTTHREKLRQWYLVRATDHGARQAVVVTLTTPAELLASMLPTLEPITARIAAETPASPPPAPPTTPTPGKTPAPAARP